MSLKSAELEIAIQVAKQAGKKTLEWFGTGDLKVATKNDGSPVTDADRAAEEVARAILAKESPADSIIGEEFGQADGTSNRVWAIDPIDGTKSFIAGIPTYSTLVALGTATSDTSATPDTRWDLGVIYIPALEELIFASNGTGCWHQATLNSEPQQTKVSQTAQLDQACIVASGADYVPFELISNTGVFRTWGDGYGYLLLATGRVDAMLDVDLAIWDYAPMIPILSEAGGDFLDWKDPAGNWDNKDSKAAITSDRGATINRVSTNGVLNAQLQKFINIS